MTFGFDLEGQIQGQTCQKCTFSSNFRIFPSNGHITIATQLASSLVLCMAVAMGTKKIYL